MSKRWLWFLKYILIPITAFLVGMGAMLWGVIRSGSLETGLDNAREKKTKVRNKIIRRFL